MRYFILLLLFISNVMALNDVTKPYNFSPRDTLKSSKFNANYDTLYNRINQNNDSIDIKFIRWYDLNSHDSTIKYLKFDTIMGATGTFSGVLATKDVNVTDLTSGYVPYKSTNLENSSIRTDGSNVSIGSAVPTTSSTNTLFLASGLFYNSASQFTARNTYYNSGWYGLVTGYASTWGYNGTTGKYTLYTDYAVAGNTYSQNARVTIDSSGSGVFSGSLSSTTLNTGNGANELYPMNQGVRTTDDVTFDSTNTTVLSSTRVRTPLLLSDSIANSGGISTKRIGIKTDGTAYGLFIRDTSIGSPHASVDVSCKYINQNVGEGSSISLSTDSIYTYTQATNKYQIFIFNGLSWIERFSITKNGLVDINGETNIDSLKLGSGSYLNTYVEGTMACTLKTSDVTVQQIGTAYYTKVGNVLTISLPQLQGTSNSVALSVYCAIPYFPKQQVSGYGYHTDIARVQDNGATLLATYSISGNPTISNRIIFNGYPTTTFTSSGTKGITAFSISYITE